MRDFIAKYTDDGSVGLYNDEVNDIYHSSYGALSEAYEKFILPANIYEFLSKNNKIKILDICFGIGYNSKAFLNLFIRNFHEKNKYINSIDTDNISDKRNYEIILHGVDIDKNLIKISPFIKQIKNSKIKNKNFYIKDEVNVILLLKLYENFGVNYLDESLIKFLTDKTNKNFFTSKMLNFALNYPKWGYQTSQRRCLSTLLHNIYYRYISNSYKNALKILKTHKIGIKLEAKDARRFIHQSTTVYDFVFLDAFSPLKAPSLWTIEFFQELYNHTHEDSMILTYSNSAAIRNAFLKNNFFVGKIYNPISKKYMGTVASKNKSLIKIPLDEFDLGLINTKAGICFRDNELSLSDSEIISNRKFETDESELMSSTHYKKEHKCSMMQ